MSTSVRGSGSRRWPYWLPLATLILGLVLTAALTAVSREQYNRNEKRLLRLRVRDAGSLLSQTATGIQTPLASAAAFADATGGSVGKFERFVAPYTTASAQEQFVSVSLWRAGSPQRGPLAVVGAAPELNLHTAVASALFAQALKVPKLHVIGLLREPDPRLGYAFGSPGTPHGFVVYAERAVPADRRSRFQSTSQFAGLDYALYLGSARNPADLVVTSVAHPPPPGAPQAQVIPFGTSTLTLVMSARGSLAGALPEVLPWIIAVGGVLLAVTAALITLRLTRRRHGAEALADEMERIAAENRRLYAEQRGIAQTLQHALLPDTLPQLPGAQTSGRYRAGERGIDIGGDWYDVIELDHRRLLLVVGDVSGRGLRAATTMASLRFAIRAYATQKDAPSAILRKLSRLVSVADSGQLATILCALVDFERGELSVTSAGHLPPLLIDDGHGRYVHSEIGLPVGVDADPSYTSITMAAPPAATLLAFTDGLVEQRGESLDEGLARLCSAAAGSNDVALGDLLERLVVELPHGVCEDDIAVVGVRWTS